jgi:hypothetical protein
MKTWMFVTAVFWLFYEMCVCPQDRERTVLCIEPRGRTVTNVGSLLLPWYSPSYVRPPPADGLQRMI